MIASRYLPNRGGLETVVYNLSQQFRAEGHDVLIVTNRYPYCLPKRETIGGIPVVRLLFSVPSWGHLRSGRWDLFLASFWFFPATFVKLVRLLWHFQPDVVNLHYLGIPGFFIWLVHRLHPFRLVISLHGGDVDGEPYRSRFARWLFGVVIRQASFITACSKHLLKQAIALEPDARSKSCVIQNGVELARFSNAVPYAHPRPYLLGVGQLVPHKGFDLLIQAFAQVNPNAWGVDLLIAGDGSERERLSRLAESLGIQKDVHLLGNRSAGEVAQLMAGSAFVIMPSRRESFGIVALEAMAAGKAVLGTQVGGLPEFADTPANVLIAPDQLEVLTDKLEDWLARLPDVSAAGDSNRSWAAQFGWPAVADRFLAVYGGEH